MNKIARNVVAVHTHTHTHTLCLQDKINEKLYIKYCKLEVDMFLLHRQTVF